MKPQLPNSSQLQTREKHIKKRQQQHFDQRHKATNLKPLQKGDKCMVIRQKVKRYCNRELCS